MPDQIVQIQTPLGIVNIDSTQATVGANTVQRQRINLTDPINDVQQAIPTTSLVVTSDPGTAGAATRPIPPTLTKGTQTALGYTTQALSDAGRNTLSFFADQVTTTNALTLVTFSYMKNGAQTTGATSYAITSAKTLRLNSISFNVFQSAATASSTKFYLMVNTAGAVTATAAQQAMAFFAAFPATANSFTAFAYDFGPQGFEIAAGASTNIGLAATESLASGNAYSITLTGFEY